MSNVLDFGVNGLMQSKVGGTGATVKYFPRLLGINGTSIGSAGLGGVSGSSVAAPLFGTAPATPSATSAIGSLYLPAQGTYNGQSFDVVASGSIGEMAISGTATVQLYVVTGKLNAPIYTSIATTGAITPLYSTEPWGIQASLVGLSDSVGGDGLLIGSYQAAIRGSVTAPTTVTTVVSQLDFVVGNPALQQGAVCGFVIGVTFGTSGANNTASLYEFTIEG